MLSKKHLSHSQKRKKKKQEDQFIESQKVLSIGSFQAIMLVVVIIQRSYMIVGQKQKNKSSNLAII